MSTESSSGNSPHGWNTAVPRPAGKDDPLVEVRELNAELEAFHRIAPGSDITAVERSGVAEDVPPI